MNTPAPSDAPEAPSPSPLSRSFPTLGKTTTLTPVFTDRAAIIWLLGHLLDRSGLSLADVAERMGCKKTSIQQYLNGRRPKPGLDWFIRFVQVCGGNLLLELR